MSNRDAALAAFYGAQRRGNSNVYGGPQLPAPAPQPPPVAAQAAQGGQMSPAQARLAELAAQNKPSGGRGGGLLGSGGSILGTVLGGGAKALGFLGKGVTAINEEWAKAMPNVLEAAMPLSLMVNEEKSREDTRSMLDKMTDADYGFGQVAYKTGNKWADRGIGFAGDVINDPLTYVGGAATKTAGLTGRAARETMGEVVRRAALEAGEEVSDDVIGKILQKGLSAVPEQYRAAVGAKEAGVYFGIGEQSVRIPGSGKIGAAMERGFASARVNTVSKITNKANLAMRVGRDNPELYLARRVANAGRTVDGMTPSEAAGIIRRRTIRDASEKTNQEVFRGEVDAILKGLDTNSARATTSQLQRGGPHPLREWFDSLYDRAEKAGIKMPKRKDNYVPQRATREGWTWMKDTPEGRAIHAATDEMDGPSFLHSRSYVPGKTVELPNGKTFKFPESGLIEDYNKALKGIGAPDMVFEEDIRVLALGYGNEVASAMATRDSFLDAMQAPGGLLQNLEQFTAEELDQAAAVTANENLAKVLKTAATARAEMAGKRLGEAANFHDEVVKLLRTSLDADIAEARAAVPGLEQELGQINKMIAETDASAEEVQARFAAMHERIDKRVADLAAESQRINDELAAEEAKIALERGAVRADEYGNAVARKQFQSMNDADIKALVESGEEIPPRLQRLVDLRLQSVAKHEEALAVKQRMTDLQEKYARIDKKLAALDKTPMTSDEIREAALDLLDDEDWPADVLPHVQGGYDLNMDLKEQLTAALERGDYEDAKAVVFNHLALADLDEARGAQRVIVAAATNRRRGAFKRMSDAAREVAAQGERRPTPAEAAAARRLKRTFVDDLVKGEELEESAKLAWDRAINEASQFPTKKAATEKLTAARGEYFDASKRARQLPQAADDVPFRAQREMSEKVFFQRQLEATNAFQQMQDAEAELDRLLKAVTQRNVKADEYEAAYQKFMDGRVKYRKAQREVERTRQLNPWDQAQEKYWAAAKEYEQALADQVEAKYGLDVLKMNTEDARALVGGGVALDQVALRRETLAALTEAADAEIAQVPAALKAVDAKIAQAQQEVVRLMTTEGSELENAALAFSFLSDYATETLSKMQKLRYARKTKFLAEKPDDVGWSRWGKLLGDTGDTELLDLNSEIAALQDDVNGIVRSVRSLLKGYGVADGEVDDVVRMIGTQRFNNVVMYVGPEDVLPGRTVRGAQYVGERGVGRPMTAYKLRKMVQEKYGAGGLSKAYAAAGVKMPFNATWSSVDAKMAAKMLGGKAETFTVKSGRAAQLGDAAIMGDRMAKAETILDALHPRHRPAVARDGAKIRKGKLSQVEAQLAALNASKKELLQKQQTAEAIKARATVMDMLAQAEDRAGSGQVTKQVKDLRRQRSEVAYEMKQLEGKEAPLRAEGDALFREAWGDKAVGDISDEMFKAQKAKSAAAQGRADEAQRIVDQKVDAWAQVDARVGRHEAKQLKALDEERSLRVADRDRVQATLDRVKQHQATLEKQRADIPKKFGKNKANGQILDRDLQLLGGIAQQALSSKQPEMVAAWDMLGRYTKALQAGNADKAAEDAMKAAEKMAKDGQLAQQMGDFVRTKIATGVRSIESRLFPEGKDFAMRDELHRMVTLTEELFRDEPAWLRHYAEANKFFKTYATSTPGFHVRNFMSASFMNMTQGAGLRDQSRGMQLWREFVKVRNSEGPNEMNKKLGQWLGQLPQQERDAFLATFGSGTGGAFEWAEISQRLADGTGSKLWDNFWTKNSRKIGVDWVEGPQRLALALHDTRNGLDMSQALAHIKQIHFDYSDLSSFDRTMKQFIPFYIFMSRNLPLQVEQMWTKPKAYAIYNHLMQNLDQSEGESELMPGYLEDMGGIVLGRDLFGSGQDIVLAPDLAHSRLDQEVANLFPDPTGQLSSLSPFLRVPAELATNHSFFFDGPLDYGGRVGAPGGMSVKDAAMYAARNIVPPIGQAERVLGAGRYEGKQLQGAAGYAGIPIKQLNDEIRASELRRRAREN